MRRMAIVAAMLFAAAARAKEPPLPIPPIPPTEPPAIAAPMPNPRTLDDAAAPSRYRVTLFSDINHRADPETGLAYAPGAQYQLDNDRRFMLPGVMVHVPLP